MARSASDRLQTATIDDVRRLLECLNALRVAIPMDRPAVLAHRLLGVLDATVVAVDSETGGEVERLATAAAAPGLPEWMTAVEPADNGALAASAPGQRHSRLEVRLFSPVTPVGVVEHTKPAGIQSTYQAADGLSVITAWRRRPFDENQQTLLRLIHPEVAWIFDGVARTVPAGLQSVLRLMLEGRKEREIAQTLGRSEHTVHAHVKRVYRHFGVNSRKQLLLQMYGSEKSV